MSAISSSRRRRPGIRSDGGNSALRSTSTAAVRRFRLIRLALAEVRAACHVSVETLTRGRGWRRRFMIEPIMYFGIGFLVASPARACRRPARAWPRGAADMRRLEAATPLSMAEIQADKDQLRAEFAMSTRRLEMSVEQLKNQDHQPARRTRQEERRHQPAQDRARRKDRDHFRARSARQGAARPVARDRGRIRGQDQPPCTTPSARSPTRKPNSPR